MKTKKILLFIILIIPLLSGNAQIKVDSNGKLGIGTLTPSSLLNVHGSSQNIEISNTAETEAGILLNDNEDKSTQYAKILFNSGNNSLNFYINNTTPRLTITSTGSFGFGTTSPSGKIHIGTDGEGAGLYFYDASVGGSSFRIYRKNGWAYITRAGDDSRGFRLDENGGVKLYVSNSVPYANFFLVKAKQDLSKCLVVEDAYSSTAKFEVHGDGDAYSRGVLLTSDASLKEDISEISSPLDKVIKLRGVSYRYKESEQVTLPVNKVDTDLDSLKENVQTIDTSEYISGEINQKIMEEQNRKHLGLVAQEVEEYVPEAVRTGSNGYKYISYSDLIGLLIEAMKEQQKIIDSLVQDISILKSEQLGNLKNTLLISKDNFSEQKDSPILYQNVPNPFDRDTEIRFYLPERSINAKLYIYNMQGNQLMSINITQRGQGSEIIHGSEFQSGMYMYTLIVDGIEIDTRRMVLTD